MLFAPADGDGWMEGWGRRDCCLFVVVAVVAACCAAVVVGAFLRLSISLFCLVSSVLFSDASIAATVDVVVGDVTPAIPPTSG
jgi:hypothetical protein